MSNTAALGFGCATIGGLHGPVTETDGLATLQAAWDGGIRCFDAAPLYGAGYGEQLLGRFLRDHPRDGVTVSTKVGWRVEAGRCVLDYSYDGVMRSFAESLGRLGLDWVDTVLIHDVDPHNHGADFPRRFTEAMDGALRALLEFRRDGRAGAVGMAVNDPAVCVAALDHGDPDMMLIAGRYTLVDQAAADELLPLCVARGVRVMVGAPFNTGVLAVGSAASARFRHGPVPAPVLARVVALEGLCARFGVSLQAAALQFPLRHEAVIRVLPGPRDPGQVRTSIAWMNEVIPDAFWQALANEGLLGSAAGPIVPGGRT